MLHLFVVIVHLLGMEDEHKETKNDTSGSRFSFLCGNSVSVFLPILSVNVFLFCGHVALLCGNCISHSGHFIYFNVLFDVIL